MSARVVVVVSAAYVLGVLSGLALPRLSRLFAGSADARDIVTMIATVICAIAAVAALVVALVALRQSKVPFVYEAAAIHHESGVHEQ